jgi:isopentenyl phosphate kinase
LDELAFVKLGGSLITNKTAEAQARPEIIARLGAEMVRSLGATPGLRLVLGHGSGSFGHVVAQRFHVQTGCSDWRGYAETSAAAMRLNRIVTDQLLVSGLPVVAVQPSASARARAGQLTSLNDTTICQVLERGLIPLVFGDVALDEAWGSTIISTETVFGYLAHILRPRRIILVGEVQGVFSEDPHCNRTATLIPVIHAGHSNPVQEGVGKSIDVDVTGGMRSKVQQMVDLVRLLPGLRVVLLTGLVDGLLERCLADPDFNPGTIIVD